MEKISRRRLLQLLGCGGMGVAAGVVSERALAATSALSHEHDSDDRLRTRLTEEYGVKYPFVGAGMGFVSLPPLVAAVSNAGGIGVLGAGIEPPPSLQALIGRIRTATPNLFGVDFLFDNSAFGPLVTDAHIQVCIDQKVPLVVFHMNVPPGPWVDALHAAGAKVWMQAASVEQAVGAVQIGVDAIIAQGVQAGGHNKSTTRTLKLLHQIKRAVEPVMVLAAGGIADGASAAKALGHGAEGVWVGTRLVASTEAYANAEYKRRIVAAKGEDTVITTMFGPEYPDRPYRVLRNRVVNQWAGREDQIPNPPPPPAVIGQTVLFPLTLRVPYTMPKFSVILPTPDTTGDFEEMGMAAGQESIQRIYDVKPAAQIVVEMMREARQRLHDALEDDAPYPS
jgi:NAD(P)H-dependent flavin oxidoreductase YrpB (nitropropane dioxygenase family)